MAARDQEDLSHLGYAQQLLRGMGGFSNFAISFSIISILTGAVTLYGYGLEMGGPLEMTLGWPLVTLGTLLVAMSMAELCSAYPTAGGVYHWAAATGGRTAGWFVAALNIAGNIAAQVGINYSCAQFALPFLGIPATTRNLVAGFAVILVAQGLINHFGVRLVAILNDFSVTVHVAGVAILIGALLWLAPKQPVSFLFQAVNSNGRHFYWWAFLLGLLQAQWTYTGFDASAALAEETEDPRRRAPWGIVLSVVVSGVAGYAMLIALTLAIRNIPAVLGAKDAHGDAVPAVIAILQQSIGARAGNALAAVAAIAMWFCGLSQITSVSRSMFSLARDNGTPFPALLSRVDPRRRTPAYAIWLIVAVSCAALIWSTEIPVITSMSTVALYLSYSLPVLFAFRARKLGWTKDAIWTLGSYGRAVNLLALVYTAVICVILVMPPNQNAGIALAAAGAVAVVVYLGVVRRGYSGPRFIRETR